MLFLVEEIRHYSISCMKLGHILLTWKQLEHRFCSILLLILVVKIMFAKSLLISLSSISSMGSQKSSMIKLHTLLIHPDFGYIWQSDKLWLAGHCHMKFLNFQQLIIFFSLCNTLSILQKASWILWTISFWFLSTFYKIGCSSIDQDMPSSCTNLKYDHILHKYTCCSCLVVPDKLCKITKII